MFKFSNTYIDLGKQFFQKTLPEQVSSPQLLLWNASLARQLNSTSGSQKLSAETAALLAQYFSGSKILTGAEPIALAYSGHQFGHFNPQLGDGRAHLLGEVIDKDNQRYDIQLKGSGKTLFSRRGDGKCALGPALREYIMSEAMFALGVPTSRCLAVVATGETINRGLAKAGAVVTRVASSHIRVGTFQYFAARGDLASLKSLVNYTIARHCPEINTTNIDNNALTDEQRIIALLDNVMTKQITLVIEWLRVGFIHGVMNTDNTAVCGETIDFGPCAMMGRYDEQAVFSSIDEYGRYAFGNQGHIAQWNTARLADCLLPLLIEEDNEDISQKEQEQRALTKIESVIHQYKGKYDRAYYTMYANKLGMEDISAENKSLVDSLLATMQQQGLDYTQTFHRLTQSLTDKLTAKVIKIELGQWFDDWLLMLNAIDSTENESLKTAQTLMAKNNPVVIPRNHHVEALLTRCEELILAEPPQAANINKLVNEFLTVLQSPYQVLATTKNYQDVPEDGDRYYQTFCGT